MNKDFLYIGQNQSFTLLFSNIYKILLSFLFSLFMGGKGGRYRALEDEDILFILDLGFLHSFGISSLIICCTCNICTRKERGNFNLEGEKGEREFEYIYKPIYVVINIRGNKFLVSGVVSYIV